MFRKKDKKSKVAESAQSIGDKVGKVVDKTVEGAKKEAKGSKTSGEKVVKSVKGGGTVLADEIGKGSKKIMKSLSKKVDEGKKK